MIREKITVTNPEGIHARPASTLVRLASRFKSEFFIYSHGFQINGKSILGVLTLAAECGAKLELEFQGEDEAAAMKAVLSLFNNDFREIDSKNG